MAKLYEGATYSPTSIINLQIKGLEKSGKAKTEAEYNTYFSFQKAYCYSILQIHSYYYYNN